MCYIEYRGFQSTGQHPRFFGISKMPRNLIFNHQFFWQLFKAEACIIMSLQVMKTQGCMPLFRCSLYQPV